MVCPQGFFSDYEHEGYYTTAVKADDYEEAIERFVEKRRRRWKNQSIVSVKDELGIVHWTSTYGPMRYVPNKLLACFPDVGVWDIDNQEEWNQLIVWMRLSDAVVVTNPEGHTIR